MLMKHQTRARLSIALAILLCGMGLPDWTGFTTTPVVSPQRSFDVTAEPPRDDEPKVEKLEVKIAEETFKLELALTPAQREKGLSGRKEIDADGGMLFAYREIDFRRFWMADCLVELDLMFVDARGRITAIHHSMKVEPPRAEDEPLEEYWARLPRYPSREMVPFALEFKAGTIRRLRLRMGDEVEFDRAALRARAS